MKIWLMSGGVDKNCVMYIQLQIINNTWVDLIKSSDTTREHTKPLSVLYVG
jgi:hypothetical protein